MPSGVIGVTSATPEPRNKDWDMMEAPLFFDSSVENIAGRKRTVFLESLRILSYNVEMQGNAANGGPL